MKSKFEFKRELEARTCSFAVSVFRLLDKLPQLPSARVIAYQLGKSASSVGANYREANRAESMDDFTHKIGIVLKECAESDYWFSILERLYPIQEEIGLLKKENEELLRIFQSVSRTCRESKE